MEHNSAFLFLTPSPGVPASVLPAPALHPVFSGRVPLKGLQWNSLKTCRVNFPVSLKIADSGRLEKGTVFLNHLFLQHLI